MPIGIIPAGSDNSLVWTVLGVRDPVSAAISIVKVMLLSKFKMRFALLAGYSVTPFID